MSFTIEGIFREILKTFVDDPLKATLKSPVIIKAYKFILIIFNQRALKDSQKIPLLLREHKKIKKVSPRHFGFQMSVTSRRSN